MSIRQQLSQRKARSRRKFVRSLLVMMAAIATIHLFARPAIPTEPVTVTILIQALEAAQWKPFVEQFETENPDIDLQLIEGPNASNQIEDLYTSSFLLGNSPYDLTYMDIVWVPKFAAAGWLLPLDDRVSPEELKEQHLAGDVAGGIYRGRLYRMPFRSDGGMLYYRTDLLAAAGKRPPETFSELMETAKELQQTQDVPWGYIWQGKQSESVAAMFVEVLQGYGGFWVNPETLEVGLDSNEAIAAVEFLRSTIEQGISPPDVTTFAEDETRLIFQNGRAAFLRNWPYVVGFASQTNSPIQGKFGIKPMVHAPGEQSGSCLGGWGFGIAKTSQHPDEAWRVIRFLSSESVQRQFTLNFGYVPSLKSLFTDPQVVAKYSHYPELLNAIENSALRPPIAQYAQASDILQRYLSAALTDRMSPQEAMAAAAQETRRLLGN
ncbi:MAG: ABC transporter substrate-binding protein [Cyanobacteriota bacterium]|nr:ABC transporter substrate-binding protein [Cyanobacteriota bacterium]